MATGKTRQENRALAMARVVVLGLVMPIGCHSSSGPDSTADASRDGSTDEVIAADSKDVGGDLAGEQICAPKCDEKQCGDNGCGQSCGSCGATLACDEPSGSCKKVALTSVAMRDDTALWTKVFLPETLPNDGAKTIVLRTPYRRFAPELAGYYDALGTFFQQRGYGFVLQDCRASYDDVGGFYAFDVEVDDGQDAVKWVVSRPWAASEVGTVGSSYDGYTALAAAVDNPAVKVIIADGLTTGISHYFKGGIPLVDVLQVIHRWNSTAAAVDYSTIVGLATNALDLNGLDASLVHTSSTTWEDLLAHPWPADPYWDSAHLRETILEKVCAPVLVTHAHEEVWSDPLQIAEALWEKSCPEHTDDVRFFFGYQGHGEALSAIPYGGGLPVNQLVLDTIDHYLGGTDLGLSSRPRVAFQSPDDADPHQASAWPPSKAELRYPLANSGADPLAGVLSSVPQAGSAHTAITVDPAAQDPCDSTAAAPTMMFVSAPLASTTYVAGSPQLELRFSASAVDADLFVTLLHFDASDSNAMPVYVSYAYERARFRRTLSKPEKLTPDVVIDWTVSMTPAAQRVPAGHSWMLLIKGSECGFVENPHTAEPLDKQTTRVTATLRAHHSTTDISSLQIPILGQ